MVTVAGPRRSHTGFLFRCALFGRSEPERDSATEHSKQVAWLWPSSGPGVPAVTAPGQDDPVNDYQKDGAEIYRQSFATIRANADLSRFSPEESQVAVRMIHSCGMVDLADDIRFSPGVVVKARAAS